MIEGETYEDTIRMIMEALGVPEKEARFIYAIEKGQRPRGDIMEGKPPGPEDEADEAEDDGT